MDFAEHIEAMRKGLRAGRFVNEASVSQGIVLRVLNAVGWPTWDTQLVCPEFPVPGGRVDFALCNPPGKPRVFIEVKQVGQGEGAERQLFEYAFHAGAPLAVLTNGCEWSFFLPGEAGDYGDRRVYKLDLLERETDECVRCFQRYLNFERVSDGTALAAAREDYQNVVRKREMEEAFPKAWLDLIDEEDEQLLDLLAARVETICGYRPDPDTVARFLKERARGSIGTDVGFQSAHSESKTTPVTPLPRGAAGLSGIGFALWGKVTRCRSGRDVLVRAIESLALSDKTFLERFSSLPKHGRTRRYIARDRKDLYPGRPDLAEEYSHELPGGFWLGTNVGSAAISRILRMACEVAGLRYGVDMRVSLE